MITFFERLDKYLKHKDLNDNKISVQASISNGIIGKARKRGSLSQENISKILYTYSELNANWLMTGDGEMIKTENNISQEKPLQYNITPKGVPYFDVDFTASFLEVENNQQSQPDSYISHPFFKDCELVVRASGQSMAKLIRHGDAIGLTRIENWSDFIPMGEIYAIVTRNNFRMIKIITKGDTPEDYTLISKPTDAKKEEFPPQPIKKTQILHIFKVQASAHLF